MTRIDTTAPAPVIEIDQDQFNRFTAWFERECADGRQSLDGMGKGWAVWKEALRGTTPPAGAQPAGMGLSELESLTLEGSAARLAQQGFNETAAILRRIRNRLTTGEKNG